MSIKSQEPCACCGVYHPPKSAPATTKHTPELAQLFQANLDRTYGAGNYVVKSASVSNKEITAVICLPPGNHKGSGIYAQLQSAVNNSINQHHQE